MRAFNITKAAVLSLVVFASIGVDAQKLRGNAPTTFEEFDPHNHKHVPAGRYDSNNEPIPSRHEKQHHTDRLLSDSPEDVTVNLKTVGPSADGGRIRINLYMSDDALADAPAKKVATKSIKIQPGQKDSTLTLSPDLTRRQAGKRYDEMERPSLYVAIDTDRSAYTYESSPVFNVQPGNTVDLKIKSKSKVVMISPAVAPIIVNVDVAGKAIGGGAVEIGLYLADGDVADLPATNVASVIANLVPGQIGAAFMLELDVDATNNGQTYSEMQNPKLYVSVDVVSGNLTPLTDDGWYVGGVRLGQEVEIKLGENRPSYI